MNRPWWQSAVIYQIYPRSFRDSNADGIGDLVGIERGLDYLQSLGVDAIWISPIFPSPMADFGYDVSDYRGIDPIFGTLADFDRLIAHAHGRGLKVLLDFVPNHTSDRHPWFTESRSSRGSAKRDWYIWRDPNPDGSPPNNWMSNFGGSAWQWDATTGQYYYHAFLAEQPDLNWRNPELRAAMYDVLRFWMRRGVDGFRVDVLWHLAKDDQLRDNPPNPDWRPGDRDIDRYLQVYSTDRPEVFDIVKEMRGVIDEFPERVLIGEIYLPLERLVAYYGSDLSGVHMPFNFQLISVPWKAADIDALIRRYEGLLPAGAWPNWVLGNHDQARIATRVGEPQAKVAMMLLLTLRGTPTLYQGDELGLEVVPIRTDEARDPWERNEPGHGRDPQRTPLPWTEGPGAGFTSGRPWLPIGTANAARSIARQQESPASMLSVTRALLALRRSRPSLNIGAYQPLPLRGDVLAFERRTPDDRVRVFLNLGSTPAELDGESAAWDILLSTECRAGEARMLLPNEGIIAVQPR